MQVRDMRLHSAVVCGPSATLAAVAQIMRASVVGSVLVVDDRGLVGIVTDRDIVVRGVAEGACPDAAVETVMSRDVCFVYDDTDLFGAAGAMAKRACRRLPVLDAEGVIQGVISLDDLVVAFAEQIDKLAQTVRKEGAVAVAPA